MQRERKQAEYHKFFFHAFKKYELKILESVLKQVKIKSEERRAFSPHYDNKIAPVEAVKMGYRPNIYQQKILEERADFFPGIVILEQTTAKFLRFVPPFDVGGSKCYDMLRK